MTNNIEIPLISVVVLTYNSSLYVLETFESIKAQTYRNIELIISDDCSTDNTVEMCREWIDQNQERFVQTHLITSSENTGIPANKNRAISKCKGEWIKSIAGDDALMSDALENIIKISYNFPLYEIFLTQIKIFNGNFEENNFQLIRPLNWEKIPAYMDNATHELQLEHILNGGYHNTPGLFIKRKIYLEIGLYDENYSLNEDTPFYLKIGLKHKLIKFIPIVTVKYRRHLNNVTRITDNKILPNYLNQVCKATFLASKEYGKLKYILNAFWNKTLVSLVIRLGNQGVVCKFINKIRLTFQPIRFYNLLNKLGI